MLKSCLFFLPAHPSNDRYSISSKNYEPHAFYRKHFWCFSTFRTKNIHISCLFFLPAHPSNDRYSISSKNYEPHAFYGKHFWCFSTFRTKNIHISCLFLPVHFSYDRYSLSSKNYEPHALYIKHFWCFSTSRTKNIHISCLFLPAHSHSKVVWCWLNEMRELRIERSVNAHGLSLMRCNALYSPDRQGPQRSGESDELKLYSTVRKGPHRSGRIGRTETLLSGPQGPSPIRTNRTNWNSTLRTVRALNDPYGSNELNLPLADRYSAGVLDMGVGYEGYRMVFTSFCRHASSAFIFTSTGSDQVCLAGSEHFRKYRMQVAITFPIAGISLSLKRNIVRQGNVAYTSSKTIQ